jgi:ribosomal protein S18 acetylase RimI-like enzyme
MERVIIRKARLSDVNQVYQLGKIIRELDFSKKYPFHERSEIKEFIGNPRENIFLVAQLGGRIIGFLYARLLSHSVGGWCMLDNIGVSGDFRNQGIGTSMLKELYKILRKNKISYIQILESMNKKTRKFWRNQGFKEAKTFIWAEKMIR